MMKAQQHSTPNPGDRMAAAKQDGFNLSKIEKQVVLLGLQKLMFQQQQAAQVRQQADQLDQQADAAFRQDTAVVREAHGVPEGVFPRYDVKQGSDDMFATFTVPGLAVVPAGDPEE